MIFIISMCVIIYGRFIFSKNLFLYTDIAFDDCGIFWPYYNHFSNYIRSFGFPMWSFYAGLGMNIFPMNLGDPFVLLTIIFKNYQIPYILVYIQILKIILAGILFFFYLKSLSLHRYVCMIGALIYAFNGHMILRGVWDGYSSEVVVVAFLLYTFELYLKEQKILFSNCYLYTC